MPGSYSRFHAIRFSAAAGSSDRARVSSAPRGTPSAEAAVAEVLAMGRQHGVFDLVHVEATAAAIGSIGIRVASWYPAPEIGLNPSQLADVYASLALRMTGARPP